LARFASTEVAVEALKDLIERVLGKSDQLPREGQELTLLIAGLRQYLPCLDRIVQGKDGLAESARQLREAPLPEGRMPLVIHTIRLAELAQAMIDRLDAQALGERADVRDSSAARRHTEALQHRPAGRKISALAGCLQDRGPPAT
jgi:hypothetical protein